jgi:hypothetical protein
MRHQRRKFLRLHSEAEKVERRQIPPGSEARMGIELVSGEVSGGKVIKRYRTPIFHEPPFDNQLLTTADELKARYKFQRELWGRGFPVPKPLGFHRKGNDIVWEEEAINGPTLAEMTAAAGKDARRVHEKAMNELEGLIGFLMMRGIRGMMDTREKNIIWDEKRKRFFVIDLGAYPRQKKMPR